MSDPRPAPDFSFEKIIDFPQHHAYLIIGNREAAHHAFRLALQKKVAAAELQAADVWSQIFQSVNIDDARALKEIQNSKPLGSRRVVLISLESIQSEAQNSLLKLFEEPTPGNLFIICVSTTEIFLPTVLSRFHIVDRHDIQPEAQNNTEKSYAEKIVPKFLTGTIKERLEILEPIIKEKNRSEAEKFLNSLEVELHKNSPEYEQTAKPEIFEDIFSARRYLRSRSPSVKMILEHISSVFPFSK